MTQGTSSDSIYYNKLKSFWEEYNSLVTLPSCVFDSSKGYLNRNKQQKVLQFLMGISKS